MTALRSAPMAASLAAILAALLATPGPVQAQEARTAPVSAGSLTILHPYLFETPPMAAAAGGYLTIENHGAKPDRLLAVEAPSLRAELHQSIEENGMHRMLPVEALELPAQAQVELAPGGYHVMFLDLDGRRLLAGETVPARLIFENAGPVEVSFTVEPRDGAAHDAHEHHEPDQGHDHDATTGHDEGEGAHDAH